MTFPPAIRIGSWLEQKADTDGRFPYGSAAALVFAAVILTCSAVADARSHRRHYRPEAEATHHVRPRPESIHWPLAIPGVQYVPVAWSDLRGWADDDQLKAFKTFKASCAPILARKPKKSDNSSDKFLGDALRAPCRAAREAKVHDVAAARAFFEAQFAPVTISRLGEDAGFVTGYYEPVIAGTLTPAPLFSTTSSAAPL